MSRKVQVVLNFSIQNLLTICFLVLLAYVLNASQQILLAAIFGMLMAYILNPIVEIMIKLPIPRIPATIFVVLGATFIITLLISWLAPIIYNDMRALAMDMPMYAERIFSGLTALSARFGIQNDVIDNFDERIMGYITQYSSQILRWTGGLAASLQHAVAITLNAVMMPVIAFVMLADYPTFQRFLDKYAGATAETPARKYIDMFSDVMSSYFRGQFIVVLILSVLYTFALKIIGVKSAVFLGIITGGLSIIPYLGYSVGLVLSMILTLAQFRDPVYLLYVFIGYSIVQALESFVITPRVVGDSLGLHPVATMIILLVGGATFGLVGMIFALPMAAILLRIYKERYSKLFNPSFEDYDISKGIKKDDGTITIIKDIENWELTELGDVEDGTLTVTDTIAERETAEAEEDEKDRG